MENHQATLKVLYKRLRELKFADSARLTAPHRPPNEIVLRMVEFVIRAIEPKRTLALWLLLDAVLDNTQWPGPGKGHERVRFAQLDENPSNLEPMWTSLVQALNFLLEIIFVPFGEKEVHSMDVKLRWALETYALALYSDTTAENAAKHAYLREIKAQEGALQQFYSAQKKLSVDLQAKQERLSKRLNWRENYDAADAIALEKAKLAEQFLGTKTQHMQKLRQLVQSTKDALSEAEAAYAHLDKQNTQIRELIARAGVDLIDLQKAAAELTHVNAHTGASALHDEAKALSKRFTDLKCSIETELEDIEHPVAISLDSLPEPLVQRVIESLSNKKKQLSSDISEVQHAVADLEDELASLAEATEQRQLDEADASVKNKTTAFEQYKRKMEEDYEAIERALQDRRNRSASLKKEIENVSRTLTTKAEEHLSEENLVTARYNHEIRPLLDQIENKRQKLDFAMSTLEGPVGALVNCANSFTKRSGDASEKANEIIVEELKLDPNPVESAIQTYEQLLP